MINIKNFYYNKSRNLYLRVCQEAQFDCKMKIGSLRLFSQGSKNKSPHITSGRIRPCPSHTACNKDSFTPCRADHTVYANSKFISVIFQHYGVWHGLQRVHIMYNSKFSLQTVSIQKWNFNTSCTPDFICRNSFQLRHFRFYDVV